MLRIFTLSFLCALSLLGCAAADDGAQLFGPVSPADYLTGRFNPARHESFVSLSDVGVPTGGRRHYLRRAAAVELKKLYDAFHKDHPKAPFWVQSSTRTYDDQKRIWDGKWNGVTKVMGADLSKAIPDRLKRAVEILKYSSMPGTSRHHWGTDVDLNVLNNAYFKSGEGRVLCAWMKANAGRFGFCQPYTAGRTAGYNEEKWHWSYRPLSSVFLARWNALYRENPAAFSRAGLFGGSEMAGSLAPVYVNGIDAGCR
ncbi:MAG: M15 family metallopeptidase [Spirochaetes bacterium]|nr:M15 family metallopeptidase [Spirochaetota bacterium]